MAGTKLVTSKQIMREVKKQNMYWYVFGRFDEKMLILGLEKIVPPVTPISDVAVTSISNISRNKRILRADDGRLKVRMQRHGTDCAIVATKGSLAVHEMAP